MLAVLSETVAVTACVVFSFFLHRQADPQTLFGIPFAPHDHQLSLQKAFASSRGGILAAMQPWQPLGLNLIGRAHVGKQSLASEVLYKASFLCPDSGTLQALDKTLRSFVARPSAAGEVGLGGARLHPGAGTCILPKAEGGINLINLPNQVIALQAKVIARLFSPRHWLWQPLMLEELKGADVRYGLASWAITAPYTFPTHILFPRTAAYIKAFARTMPLLRCKAYISGLGLGLGLGRPRRQPLCAVY